MLVASVSSGTSLRATQEETAAAPTETSDDVLKVPVDLSDEAIEGVNAELAQKLSPNLAILFDATQPTEARRAAAAELLDGAGQIQVTSPELESLQRRLQRRALLMDAAIQASEVPNIAAGPNDQQANLKSAASKAQDSLSRIVNGQLWADYLHLKEILEATASTDVLNQVLRNLSITESMSAQQLAFASRPEIEELKAAVEAALAAASFSDDEASARTELQSRVQSLTIAFLAYEKDPRAVEAEKARSAWRILRSRFPAAADLLRPVVNENYFNHNVHFTVSEELLSRLISDYRTESGRIADCIMGAWVTGSQTTSVNVVADILPSATAARFHLNVNGNTQSNTRAQKDPATIWTNGNHYFWINRAVTFDGRHIVADTASFSVDTNSRTVGLATAYDGIPIIRGIVRKIAAQKIAESKPQSDAITARKLREEALPRFESETNEQFSDGNETLKKTLDSLERRGVAPDSISARSSNTHLAVSSRTIGVSRLGGSLQPVAAVKAKGAAAQVHETALNDAIDALGFQGRDVPEKDFVTELETALGELFQREINLTDDEPEPTPEGEEPEPPTVFNFSKTDPIRVRFEKGQIVLVLRTGVQQEGREDIPEQIITIPITVSLQNEKVLLEPGNIGVASREEADRRKQQTRAVQIKRIMSRRIVRKELSPTIDLQAAGDKKLPVTVTHIELSDGWATAEVQ
jgi:hypothetical protein